MECGSLCPGTVRPTNLLACFVQRAAVPQPRALQLGLTGKPIHRGARGTRCRPGRGDGSAETAASPRQQHVQLCARHHGAPDPASQSPRRDSRADQSLLPVSPAPRPSQPRAVRLVASPQRGRVLYMARYCRLQGRRRLRALSEYLSPPTAFGHRECKAVRMRSSAVLEL